MTRAVFPLQAQNPGCHQHNLSLCLQTGLQQDELHGALSSTSLRPLGHLQNAATARALPAEWVRLGTTGDELQELSRHMLLMSPVPKISSLHGSALGLGCWWQEGTRGHASTSIPTALRLPRLSHTLSPLTGSSPYLDKFGRACTEHLSHRYLVLIPGAAQQPTLLRIRNLPMLRPS